MGWGDAKGVEMRGLEMRGLDRGGYVSAFLGQASISCKGSSASVHGNDTLGYLTKRKSFTCHLGLRWVMGDPQS